MTMPRATIPVEHEPELYVRDESFWQRGFYRYYVFAQGSFCRRKSAKRAAERERQRKRYTELEQRVWKLENPPEP